MDASLVMRFHPLGLATHLRVAVTQETLHQQYFNKSKFRRPLNRNLFPMRLRSTNHVLRLLQFPNFIPCLLRPSKVKDWMIHQVIARTLAHVMMGIYPPKGRVQSCLQGRKFFARLRDARDSELAQPKQTLVTQATRLILLK